MTSVADAVLNSWAGSPTRLEGAVLNSVEWLMDEAWRPNANNDRIADELTSLVRVLKLAGYDISPILNRWQANYDIYKMDGGRARFRGISNS